VIVTFKEKAAAEIARSNSRAIGHDLESRIDATRRCRPARGILLLRDAEAQRVAWRAPEANTSRASTRFRSQTIHALSVAPSCKFNDRGGTRSTVR